MRDVGDDDDGDNDDDGDDGDDDNDDDDHNLVVAALGRRSILVITSSIGTGPHSFSTFKVVDHHPSSYITCLFSV